MCAICEGQVTGGGTVSLDLPLGMSALIASATLRRALLPLASQDRLPKEALKAPYQFLNVRSER